MKKLVLAVGVGALISSASMAREFTRGVPINSQDGKVNYLGFDAVGSPENLSRLAEEAKVIKCNVGPIDREPDGLHHMRVFFNSDVGSDAAVKLAGRAETGEFGPIKIRDIVQPFETLGQQQ